jgi:hypothetical protein
VETPADRRLAGRSKKPLGGLPDTAHQRLSARLEELERESDPAQRPAQGYSALCVSDLGPRIRPLTVRAQPAMLTRASSRPVSRLTRRRQGKKAVGPKKPKQPSAATGLFAPKSYGFVRHKVFRTYDRRRYNSLGATAHTPPPLLKQAGTCSIPLSSHTHASAVTEERSVRRSGGRAAIVPPRDRTAGQDALAGRHGAPRDEPVSRWPS